MINANSNTPNESKKHYANESIYEFQTGVKCILNRKTLELTEASSKSKRSIASVNLDFVNYSESILPTISGATLYFRFLGILFLVILFLAFIADSFWVTNGNSVDGFLGTLGVIGLAGGFGVLVVLLMLFDALFDLGIVKATIKHNYSSHGYEVTIGNTNGADLTFRILDSELSKLSALSQEIESIKSEIQVEQQKSTLSPDPNSSNFKAFNSISNNKEKSYIDELEQLNELRNDGVLTTEEFNAMKAKVLQSIR